MVSISRKSELGIDVNGLNESLNCAIGLTLSAFSEKSA